MSHPMLASSVSLTQLTVTTTPYKAQPLLPSAAIIRWLCGGATRVSSRLFQDASTRPYCPEALFLFFSGKLSLPYAPGSSPNTKRTNRRRSLKPKLHSTGPRRLIDCTGITPLRMAATPPYGCTRLPSLHRNIPTHAYYTLVTSSSII